MKIKAFSWKKFPAKKKLLLAVYTDTTSTFVVITFVSLNNSLELNHSYF